MKVTDKRMFTPEGELRQDSTDFESSDRPQTTTDKPDGPADFAETAPEVDASAERVFEGDAGPSESADQEGARAEEAERRAPMFLDLVALLAEPIALYLGDVRLPDGKPAEDISLARFHIDLLDILKQKCAGNLSEEEAGILEDLLYRLRIRYVQKNG
jgi:hypothetical protein